MDAKVEWIDVRDWVLDTYPWRNSSDIKNLNTVTREDVGFIQGRGYIELELGVVLMIVSTVVLK